MMKSDSGKNPQNPDEASAGTSGFSAARPVVLKSEDLFRGEREIHIQHGESLYRLQITKAGKLILIK